MLDPSVMPELLAAFLAQQQPTWRNVKVSSYEVMTGGYSRLLAKAVVEHDDGSVVLVLRGDPPADKILIHTDRAQEWELLQALSKHGVRTPTARHFDASGEQLGTVALVIDFSQATSFLPYVAGGGSTEGLNRSRLGSTAPPVGMPTCRNVSTNGAAPPTNTSRICRCCGTWPVGSTRTAQ